MIAVVNTIEFTEKFASLITGLYVDANIPLLNISSAIIENKYFLLPEQNKIETFMDTSLEDFARKSFGVRTFKTNRTNEIVYWAAIQYCKIFLNCRIPMQRIALQCPLDKMCSHFAIYHEMDERKMIDEFIQNESKSNILSLLRKKRGLSIKELSFLTGIPVYTLRHYEKNNENLFNASFGTISALSKVLNISSVLFRRETDFLPYTISLWNNSIFVETFKNKAVEAFNITKDLDDGDADLLEIKPGYFTMNDIENISSETPILFVYSTAVLCRKKRKKVKRAYLTDQMLERALRQALIATQDDITYLF